jgi:hypothetical protein
MDNQFRIHILIDMTSDYYLQLAMMEKRVNDKVNPLTINEIRDDLNIHLEILNNEAKEENLSEVVEYLALFDGQCNENAEIVGQKQDSTKW